MGGAVRADPTRRGERREVRREHLESCAVSGRFTCRQGCRGVLQLKAPGSPLPPGRGPPWRPHTLSRWLGAARGKCGGAQAAGGFRVHHWGPLVNYAAHSWGSLRAFSRMPHYSACRTQLRGEGPVLTRHPVPFSPLLGLGCSDLHWRNLWAKCCSVVSSTCRGALHGDSTSGEPPCTQGGCSHVPPQLKRPRALGLQELGSEGLWARHSGHQQTLQVDGGALTPGLAPLTPAGPTSLLKGYCLLFIRHSSCPAPFSAPHVPRTDT